MVQGFTDPALGTLRTESPTCSRRARQIFLALCASLRLQLQKGDVKAAFLQGDAEQRTVLVECVPELRAAELASRTEGLALGTARAFAADGPKGRAAAASAAAKL